MRKDDQDTINTKTWHLPWDGLENGNKEALTIGNSKDAIAETQMTIIKMDAKRGE